MRQWLVKDFKSGLDALELQDSVKVPEVGDSDVLVKIQAVSLNYRDLAIPRVLTTCLQVDPHAH